MANLQDLRELGRSRDRPFSIWCDWCARLFPEDVYDQHVRLFHRERIQPTTRTSWCGICHQPFEHSKSFPPNECGPCDLAERKKLSGEDASRARVAKIVDDTLRIYRLTGRIPYRPEMPVELL